MDSPVTAAVQAAAGFGYLPAALHLHVLSFLPLVGRVRCALVARSWNELLGDPAFWAELRFDGAPEGSVDDETLLQLCRRACGRLRTLDVSDPSCDDVTLDDGFLKAFASEGLGRSLETLCAFAPGRRFPRHWMPGRCIPGCLFRRVSTPSRAAALLAACPALFSASVEVHNAEADVAGAVQTLLLLPRPGDKRLSVTGPGYDRPREVSWSGLTDSLTDALAATSVAELDLWGLDLSWNGIVAEPAAEAAAERLAAALADPRRGVRSLTVQYGGLLVASLGRALTEESPLEALSLSGVPVPDALSTPLADALAPGRSRLRSLMILGCTVGANESLGWVTLLTALGANETVTELDLSGTQWDGCPAADAALADALRSNATLRSLDLSGCHIPLRGVFGALGSRRASPSRCALASLKVSNQALDMPTCHTLGESLASGASLESLTMLSTFLVPDAVPAIANGIITAGGASRLRSLRFEKTPIEFVGAAALARALAEPACVIETLVFRHCQITDEGGVEIALALAAAEAASSLRCLNISNNGLGAKAAEAFGLALAVQGRCGGALRKLSLAGNKIGRGGAERLAEGLRANSSLETLNLSGNNILAKGAAAVAAAVSAASSGLTTLLLKKNKIGDEGVFAMLQAGLLRNTTLTEFHLMNNDLTDEGRLALAHWGAARFGAATEEEEEELAAAAAGGAGDAASGVSKAGAGVGSVEGGGGGDDGTAVVGARSATAEGAAGRAAAPLRQLGQGAASADATTGTATATAVIGSSRRPLAIRTRGLADGRCGTEAARTIAQIVSRVNNRRAAAGPAASGVGGVMTKYRRKGLLTMVFGGEEGDFEESDSDDNFEEEDDEEYGEEDSEVDYYFEDEEAEDDDDEGDFMM